MEIISLLAAENVEKHRFTIYHVVIGLAWKVFITYVFFLDARRLLVS